MLFRSDHAVYLTIHEAARSGNLEIIKYLVEKGVKISDHVVRAASRGHQDIADYLNNIIQQTNTQR